MPGGENNREVGVVIRLRGSAQVLPCPLGPCEPLLPNRATLPDRLVHRQVLDGPDGLLMVYLGATIEPCELGSCLVRRTGLAASDDGRT